MSQVTTGTCFTVRMQWATSHPCSVPIIPAYCIANIKTETVPSKSLLLAPTLTTLCHHPAVCQHLHGTSLRHYETLNAKASKLVVGQAICHLILYVYSTQCPLMQCQMPMPMQCAQCSLMPAVPNAGESLPMPMQWVNNSHCQL
jgi:hypothetical protein